MALRTLPGPLAAMRDFVLIGTITPLLTLAFFRYPAPWVAAGCVAGACTGLFAGVVARGLAQRGGSWLGSMFQGLFLGGLWGASTGALAAGGMFFGDGVMATGMALAAAIGGVAGAIQLSWLLPAWSARHQRGASTWPVLAAGAGVASVLFLPVATVLDAVF